MDENAPTFDDHGSVGLHPVETDRAVITTRGLNATATAVNQIVQNMDPGAILYGNPRVGKTEACLFLLLNASRLFGSAIPGALHSCSEAEQSRTTDNKFFTGLLISLSYGAPSSGTAVDKLRRLTNLIVERAQRAREFRFLLFVDEAHWLQDVQLTFLMDLYNQVNRRGVKMITFLVGGPKLLEKKTSLAEEHQTQLTHRFMVSTVLHEGILDLSDFRRFCRGFDRGQDWPVGSGRCFTEHFVPLAHAGGWRLEEEAGKIWNTMLAERRHLGDPEEGELPLQALMSMMRWLLQHLREHDVAGLTLDRGTIETAYRRTAAAQVSEHLRLPSILQ